MKYDVIVVGGGPAGLSSAYTAAKGGARVAVFEKSKEIGYPIHTSGGSWIDALKKLQIPEKFIYPIREGYFVSENATARFRYENPPSCVLDIRGLYQYLAEIASAEGAEIFVNSTVSKPHFEKNRLCGVYVRRFGKEQFFDAPLIIDASGASSLLARKMGMTNGFGRVGLGAEYDLFAPNWPQDRVAFLFGNKVAPSGYGWIFPYKENRIRLGVGLIYPDSKDDPRRYLEDILKNSKLFRKELAGVSRIEYHTGVIPSDGFLKKTVANGFMVVGDAGGLISTLLGEGIRFAIDIGRMAGGVAAEAVQKQRFDEKFLKKYESLWKKKYQNIFKIGSLINKRLANYSDEKWDERIGQLARLDPDDVAALLKGDFRAKLLLRFFQKNSKLLRDALKSKSKMLAFN